MPRDALGASGADQSIIGGTFRDAARVLRGQGLRIVVLSILVMGPVEALAGWLQFHPLGKLHSPLSIAYLTLVPRFAQSVGSSLYIGGLAWSIERFLNGEPARLPDVIRHAMRRWPAMLGVELLLSAATLGGLVLLVVPGLMIVSRWLVAPQIVAVEGIGVRDALTRSAYLTKGRRWQALGVFVLEMAVYYGGYYVIQLILAALLGAAYYEPLPVVLNRHLIVPLFSALNIAVAVAFYTAFFHRLTATRGSRGEIAAQVFD